MSGLLGIIALNLGYEAFGAGFLLLCNIGPRRVRSADFVLLAYACGIALEGILSAQLALAGRLPGLGGMLAIAAGMVIAGAVRRRSRPGRQDRWTASHWGLYDLVTAAGTLSVLAVSAVRFRVFELGAWDGWAIWSTKAHALLDPAGVGSAVFRDPSYLHTHLDYPLLFPALEAGELHARGGFSPTGLHLELIFLLAGFAAGLLALLRTASLPSVRMVVVLGLVASPTLVDRLATNYADLPLAFFVTLGLVSLARWTMSGERGYLILATLFLGAAMLTKSEGAIFALAAFGIGACLRPVAGARRRDLALAAASAAALVVPWRIFTAAHHLGDTDFDLGRTVSPRFLADRVDRIAPAYNALVFDIFTRWDVFALWSVLALLIAFAARRRRLSGLAIGWALCSFVLLLGTYWISLLPIHDHLRTSGDRVVTSIVVGMFALSALIVSDAAQAERSAMGGLRHRRPRLAPGPVGTTSI